MINIALCILSRINCFIALLANIFIKLKRRENLIIFDIAVDSLKCTVKIIDTLFYYQRGLKRKSVKNRFEWNKKNRLGVCCKNSFSDTMRETSKPTRSWFRLWFKRNVLHVDLALRNATKKHYAQHKTSTHYWHRFLVFRCCFD